MTFDMMTPLSGTLMISILLLGGKKSPTTEFTMVEQGLSFREFNQYINSLDGGKGRTR